MKVFKSILGIVGLGLVLAEYYVMANFEEMPLYWIAFFAHYGFAFRAFTFSIIWLVFLPNSKSLVEQFESQKAENPKRFFSENEKKWLIFVYAILSFFAIISFHFISLSPTIPLVFYCLVLVAAMGFTFFEIDEKSNIRNDKFSVNTENSICLEGEKGEFLNIDNPFRGISVIASNGSGKSVSTVEPFIEQFAKKDFCGILYDFKFPTLSNIAYLHFSRKGLSSKFYIINFTDLSRTHCINPLKPELLLNQTFANECSLSILKSLQGLGGEKVDFWIDSAEGLLTGIIWFLKKHYPQYCTLPHVINLVVGDTKGKLLDRLDEDYECAAMIRSTLTAREAKAGSQLAGVLASLQSPMRKLNIPEWLYVLSGDDVDLDINDPTTPKVICVGTAANLSRALSPIVSLIFTVALKNMNQENRPKSFCLLDEAPQLFIPHITDTASTARSRKLSLIYVAQDISQIDAKYGQHDRKTLFANLNTQLYLRTSLPETAKYLQEIIGTKKKVIRTESANPSTKSNGNWLFGNKNSYHYSMANEPIITPEEAQSLNVGEILGRKAIEDATPTTFFSWRKKSSPIFRLRVKRPIFNTPESTNGKYENGKFITFDRPIPAFRTNPKVQETVEKIKQECQNILEKSIKN